MKPFVAIVGRPNVGKSTFFNRVTRSKDALVSNFPGVTRDRHYLDAKWNGVEFTLVDTGGFTDGDEDRFAGQIRFHIHQAINDSDVLILILDGKYGVSPFDRDIVKMLHSIKKPVFYAVNKIDGLEQEDKMYEFYQLGIEELHPISAEHGYGIPDFLDKIIVSLPKTASSTYRNEINLAVVGRPNVGKSSLINRILGQERLLVSDVPGTTRDAIDTRFDYKGQSYLFIDTAGIRRKKKVSHKLEKFSIIKALKSLESCDVALIVLNSMDGVTEQDITIAGYAFERGCGCIFLLNKWDLVEKDTRTAKEHIDRLKYEAKFLPFAPAVTISALTGLRVFKIFTLVQNVYEQYIFRISTGPLNRIMEKAVEKNEPSLHKGRRLKFYYTTQTGIKPPTFVSFVNYPEAVHFSYQRYLVNQIRSETNLDKTPIRLFFRKRKGREKR